MYCTFYGLKERPFTLTPNPDFIFLGRAHQEAFAHLIYGLEQKVGFIALTGEVGAGKTTVIRTLLTRLDSAVYSTALILNPMLSSLGLLKTINREYGISDNGDEPAELVEALNSFLLQEKEAGRIVVLVIDETQDMDPEVLEQVRLLSNLETARDKLIQIILVGQPELETLLARPELRQLNQRITVRYHLTPMDAADTRDYIAHRLRIAGAGPEMVRFSKNAVQSVHGYAGGLPRLVNAVADRALLIGYTTEARIIEPSQVRSAINDVAPATKKNMKLPLYSIVAAVVVILLVIAGIRLMQHPTAVADKSATTANPVAPPPLNTILQKLQQTNNRQDIYKEILKAWQSKTATAILPANTALENGLKQAGFELHNFNGSLGNLARLGYPAILELSLENGRKGRLVFAGLTKNHALVMNDYGALVEINPAELEQVWSGRALVPWKNMLGLAIPTPYMANEEQRLQLVRLLVANGVLQESATTPHETSVRDALRLFQQKNGLDTDGVAGEQTLMILYRQSGDFKMPNIQKVETIR